MTTSTDEPARQKRNDIRVQPATATYAAQMEDLMHACYGTTREEPFHIFTEAMFRSHQQYFPEGQFIAVEQATDRVVGLTVSMRTHFNLRLPQLPEWWSSTGDGWLSTHQPHGDWMYGVESCVHPDFRSAGVGGQLMDARFAVLRRLNLRGMVAGSAIVSYYQHPELAVEDYIQAVVEGRLFDQNLSKQIRKGFKPLAPIPDFVDDWEALGWGVLMVWMNPDYQTRVRRSGGD
jgi:GNAT superfamily N-acetyltransferase